MKKLALLCALTLAGTSACSKSRDEDEARTEVPQEQATESGENEQADETGAAIGEEAAEGEAAVEGADEVAEPAPNPVTQDILDREPLTETAEVKHILISWDEKAGVYERRGGQDERATERTRLDANALVADLLQRTRDGVDFDGLMAEFSEDEGSAEVGRPYPVTPDSRLVQPFKDLSLRLELNEAGVVETMFGYHIIKRTL